MNFKVFRRKFLVGDIHGTWSVITNHLAQFQDEVGKAREMDIANTGYIQVGDFGIGFNDLQYDVDRLMRLNQTLKDNLAYLYIIRGNHDDPNWFRPENFKEVKEALDHIMFIPDYTILNLDLEDILFIGGATSIDRIPLRFRPYVAWWKDEVFPFSEEKLKAIRGVERLVMHTTPDFCEPVKMGQIVYNYAATDPDLLKDLEAERARVTRAFNILTLDEDGGKNPIKGLYYGHFHRDYNMIHNNCEFVCLGVNTIKRL